MFLEFAVQNSNASKDVRLEIRSLGSRALLLFCSTSNLLNARNIQKDFSVIKTLRGPIVSALTQASWFLLAKRPLRVSNTTRANRFPFGFGKEKDLSKKVKAVRA